jgi:hypothetical protein
VRKTILILVFLFTTGWGAFSLSRGAAAKTPDWAFNATVIEACSCPMFCQCYFNTQPAAHHTHGGAMEHFCRANFGYKVNRGHFGDVKLDGAKLWLAGDLGGDFSQGHADWLEVTFDPSVTKPQRDGIVTILNHIYPFKWAAVTVGKDAAVEWSATKDRAQARLNGGKNAEIALHRGPGMTADPVVIRNLRYFGAPRNEGFILMPNDIEAYRVGAKPFEYKGTNGFMITVDATSSDFK